MRHVTKPAVLELGMGNLPIHIYGYNNEHDVIIYKVIKDT